MIARLTKRSAVAVPATKVAPAAAPASEASAAEPRYELKAVCERAGLEQIVAELRLRGACFRPLHPRRTVQSMYFDTPSGRALEENLAGISRREKLRLRWYGQAATAVAAVMERKIRENKLGWKETLRLADTIDVEGASRLGFLRRLDRLITPEWREAIAGHEPVQWVTYDRDYLVTNDGAIRMTIDQNLRFFEQRCSPVLSSRRRPLAPEVVVIECKAPASHEGRLHELLAGFPLMIDKCSKFAMACGEGGPIVPILTL